MLPAQAQGNPVHPKTPHAACATRGICYSVLKVPPRAGGLGKAERGMVGWGVRLLLLLPPCGSARLSAPVTVLPCSACLPSVSVSLSFVLCVSLFLSAFLPLSLPVSLRHCLCYCLSVWLTLSWPAFSQQDRIFCASSACRLSLHPMQRVRHGH